MENLVWVWGAGVGYADVVIVEHHGHSRHRHFGYVATDTVLSGLGTDFCAFHAVTRQASPVVMRVVADDFPVRIVAGGAAYAFVVSQEALAEGQAVRLKADIFFTQQTLPDHGFPSVMTLSAEGGHFFGGHLTQFPGERRGRTAG